MSRQVLSVMALFLPESLCLVIIPIFLISRLSAIRWLKELKFLNRYLQEFGRCLIMMLLYIVSLSLIVTISMRLVSWVWSLKILLIQ